MAEDIMVLEGVVVDESDRAVFVRQRLLAINRDVSERYLENGLLLKEMKANGYYKEWGYASFDACINDMHQQGLLDYCARNANHFVRVIEMVQKLDLDTDVVKKIPISKLREIASVPEKEQRRLLEAANTMTVDQVQREAKRLRDKAAGRETDPLRPVTLMFTETMYTFWQTVIAKSRIVFAIDEKVPDAVVVCDYIFPEFFSGLPDLEAHELEGQCSPS